MILIWGFLVCCSFFDWLNAWLLGWLVGFFCLVWREGGRIWLVGWVGFFSLDKFFFISLTSSLEKQLLLAVPVHLCYWLVFKLSHSLFKKESKKVSQILPC